MKKVISRLRPRTLGQAIIEFALMVPLLLMLLFGIIEFGRLIHAWLAVQNAARFALRYVVTGEFDQDYCAQAAVALGLESEDAFGGAPAGDCRVPDAYDAAMSPPIGQQAADLTAMLEDWARLPATGDQGSRGSTGVLVDMSVSGDYLAFLASHNLEFLGDPSVAQYYHVTVCSNRDADADGVADFQMDETSHPPTCYDTDGFYMDDPGGPGDRVRVIVSYVHPVIVPLLSSIFPQVALSASREGVVEQFRTSRVSGIGVQIGDRPTDTPIPTVTSTATETGTATETSTPAPTLTNTPTPTETPTMTPTATPTPSCDLFETSDLYFTADYGGTDIKFNYDNLNNFRIYVDDITTVWPGIWHDQVQHTPYPDNQYFSGYSYYAGMFDDKPNVLLEPGFDHTDTGLDPAAWNVDQGENGNLGVRFTQSFASYYVYYHLHDFTVSFNFHIVDEGENTVLECSRTLTGPYGPVVVPTQPANPITGPFSVAAGATDPDGTISRVRFAIYSGTTSLGTRTDTVAPYCLFGDTGGVCNTRTRGDTWCNNCPAIANGDYSIQIQGRDNDVPGTYTYHYTRIVTTLQINIPDTATPTRTTTPTNTPTPCPRNGTGLEGDYYNFTGSAPPSVNNPPAAPLATGLTLVRIDPQVDFDWGGGSPGAGVTADKFMVRWWGRIVPRYPNETVTIYARTDDGVRVWVNGTRIINRWQNQSATEVSGDISLPGCGPYSIYMYMYDNTGNGVAQLSWSSPMQEKEIIPMLNLYPPPTGTAIITSTPAPATATRTRTASPTVTNTPGPTRTRTATPTVTLTPKPATPTRTPTRTTVPTSTNTTVPAIHTPTNTPVTPGVPTVTRTRTITPTRTRTPTPDCPEC